MSAINWIEMVTGGFLIAAAGGAAVACRRISREWQLLAESRAGMVSSWADANTLWAAETAYGEALNQLMRAVVIAAGRRALDDPRVSAAIEAADDALDRVLAQSRRHADTPAGERIPA